MQTIYIIIDLYTGLRYVGITANKVLMRWLEHVSGARKCSEMVRVRALRSGAERLKLYKIGTTASRATAEMAERFFMRHYDTLVAGGNGLNVEGAVGEAALCADFVASWEEVDTKAALAFMRAHLTGKSAQQKEGDIMRYARARRLLGTDGDAAGGEAARLTPEQTASACASLPRLRRTTEVGRLMLERAGTGVTLPMAFIKVWLKSAPPAGGGAVSVLDPVLQEGEQEGGAEAVQAVMAPPGEGWTSSYGWKTLAELEIGELERVR